MIVGHAVQVLPRHFGKYDTDRGKDGAGRHRLTYQVGGSEPRGLGIARSLRPPRRRSGGSVTIIEFGDFQCP